MSKARVGSVNYTISYSDEGYSDTTVYTARNMHDALISGQMIIEDKFNGPINMVIGNIKQVTIKNNNKWYAIFTVEMVYPIFKFINLKKIVAIDLGIKSFIVDSNNNKIEKPKPENRLIRRLKLIQRKIISRRKKGSNNYKKAKRLYQIIQERIANKRRDFLHKLSRDYANKYYVIVVEDLVVKNMLEDKPLDTNKKNNTLHRNIHDSSFRRFIDLLKYKAKMIISVNPSDSTQECYRCGNIVKKELEDRIHYCPNCNIKIDRDLNSSLVHLKRGIEILLKILPKELGEVTLGEILRSMNQEASPFKVG